MLIVNGAMVHLLAFTIMCLLLSWNLHLFCLSNPWRKAIALATSRANLSARAVSTTTPVPPCKSLCKLPLAMYCETVANCGGWFTHPRTGSTFGWENIRSLGNSSLKSLDIRAVHSRTFKIFATISLFCQRPLQVSPLGVLAKWVCKARSAMLMPLCLDRVASPTIIIRPFKVNFSVCPWKKEG